MRHKYSLTQRQIHMLEELIEADRKNNGICFQQADGAYNKENKEDVELLYSIGFITEYTSEAKRQADKLVTLKGWTITYQGIAFIYAFYTMFDQLK